MADIAYSIAYQPKVNWADPVETEIEYKTEIFESRTGIETRTSQREKPRRSVRYSALMAGAAHRDFRHLAARYGRERWAVADFLRAQPLAISTPIRTQITSVDLDAPYWLRTGRLAAVWSGDEWQVRRIESTRAGVIVFDAPVWVTTESKIAPVMLARLPENTELTRRTAGVSTARLLFAEEPTTALDPVNPLTAELWPQYRGWPVFSIKPNWRDDVSDTFNRPADVLDFGYGAIDVTTPHREARMAMNYVALGRTAEYLWTVVDFFCRRRGRAEAFYAPTWSDDFELAEPMIEGSRRMVVRGVTAHELISSSLVYRNIAFVTEAGLEAFGIYGSSTDGDTTVITLDAPATSGAVSARMMSWFLLWRFASDTFRVEWRTNDVGEFDINLTALIETFFELQIAEDRIMIAGEYIVMSPHYPKAAPFRWATIGGDALLVSDDFAGVGQ